MSIDYLDEKRFLQEIGAAGEVWVARGSYANIYAVEIDPTGFSLPVWSSKERAAEFLLNARPLGPKYEPHAIPLDEFTNAWLSDKMKAIAEVQINPDGKTRRALCLSTEEFIASQSRRE